MYAPVDGRFRAVEVCCIACKVWPEGFIRHVCAAAGKLNPDEFEGYAHVFFAPSSVCTLPAVLSLVMKRLLWL